MKTVTLLTVLGAIGFSACDARESLDALLCPPASAGNDALDAVTRAVSGRLPTALVPLHYNLTVQPHLQPPWRVQGWLTVTMDVRNTTSNVTLNMLDIVTHNDTVQVHEKTLDNTTVAVSVLRQEYDPVRQMYTAVLAAPLQAGSVCTLSMQYTAVLGDRLVGFYRSSYRTSQGETRWLATTQFSPTDARRAFPCFDEPAFKSSFTVALVHAPNLTARSNMPRLSAETRPDGWVVSRFTTTPLMSTFIVAFHVSDFVSFPVKKVGDTNFTVWSRPDVIKQGNYSYSVAPAFLTFLEGYFNSSFPLPKLDMVAVPDFKFSGMENWGLINYRETAMLLDDLKSSPNDLFDLTYTIAHEVSHQWFGNLVTPAWWSELWLKEGFASFMGYIAMDSVLRDWSVMERFVVWYQQDVMKLDSLLSSHPINVPVNHPDEIGEIFDRISYKKGASILRMLYHFVGPQAFREGLSNYVHQLQYSTANQEDLWSHLTATARDALPAGVSVKTIMDTWTYKQGYPVLNVVRSNGTLELTQEQFLLGGRNLSAAWWVPVTVTTAAAPDFSSAVPKTWLRDDPREIVMMEVEAGADDWVVLNLNATGFYRVNYALQEWRLLARQLLEDHTVLPPAQRAALLDDAFALAREGRLNYSLALDLTKYLRAERHFLTWQAARGGFRYLYRILRRDPVFGHLQEYLHSLVSGWYEHVGSFEDSSPGESYPVLSAREAAVSYACGLELPHCVSTATQVFEAWIKDERAALPALVRRSVLCTGVAMGGREVWEVLWQRYLNTTLPAVRDHMRRALGCSREPWLLHRYLERAFTPESGVQKQDATRVFYSVVGNRFGREVAWDFLRQHWRRIVDYLGSSNTALGGLVSNVAAGLTTDIDVFEFEVFSRAQEGHLGAAAMAVKQGRETARINSDWFKRHYGTVKSWLEQRHEATPA